eukprot:10087208-Alexandrium_andersonii.AAC.1
MRLPRANSCGVMRAPAWHALRRALWASLKSGCLHKVMGQQTLWTPPSEALVAATARRLLFRKASLSVRFKAP